MLAHKTDPDDGGTQADHQRDTGPSELLADLAALERTSLGSASARRIRTRATASRLAHILNQHEFNGEAITILEKVAADRVRILGPEHPETQAAAEALRE
jgi:hypothetical protein